jgi:hypothetical protein
MHGPSWGEKKEKEKKKKKNFVEILSVVSETKYSTVQERYYVRPSVCNPASTTNRWTDFDLIRDAFAISFRAVPILDRNSAK